MGKAAFRTKGSERVQWMKEPLNHRVVLGQVDQRMFERSGQHQSAIQDRSVDHESCSGDAISRGYIYRGMVEIVDRQFASHRPNR